MTLNCWKRWLNRLRAGARSSGRRGERLRGQRAILRVDSLEDRFVPSTITQWNFESPLTIAVNNSPAPSTGTGTASGLGMTNSYNSTTSTNTDDVVQGASGDTGNDGLADTTQVWRIRGLTANGWSSQAPIGTQGAEFAASTVGYSSINVSFDWYATTQGEGKLQLEYTTDGTTWNNVAITVPTADTATTAHTNSSSANTVMGSYVQVSGQNWSPNLTATISDPNAANDPNFAIELVNASTGADCVNTTGAALNNTSGNWRFDNVTISGTVQPAAPTVTSPTANPVGINTATLGGTVTSIGSQPVTEYGVVYALTSSITAQNPLQIGNTGVFKAVDNAALSINTPFTVSVSGLAGTSGYSYAAYATNSVGTSYSSVSTFTTQSANAPTVDTPTDTPITGMSATLGGTVETDGGAAVSESGVVYALASNPHPLTIGSTGVTKLDTGSPVDNGTSPAPAFTVPVSGLSFNTAYVFAAFATNSSGTTYSSPATQFTTLAAPTVTSPTVTAVNGNSATLGGDVTSTGSAGSLTQSGIIYALTSNPHPLQLGSPGVTELDTGGTTGIFTVPATGLSGSTSYTFEAFATSSVGTSYSTATSFTTAAPGTIAAWTFPTTASATPNSPSPTYGTGTATTLGMNNNYQNLAGNSSTANDDITSTSGTANPGLPKISGASAAPSPQNGNPGAPPSGPNNGWALAAPEYSQGIELDTSTVGESNIVFAFNWYSTTQGIRDLQVQYNTGSGWVNYQGPSPTGTFIATSNDFYNAGLSPVNPTIYIHLSGVPAANNNPDLGIRLVSAYDSTGTLGNVYASAASTAGDIIPYNNNSGNWRFGNLTFSAGITTTTAITANPPLGQSPGQNVAFTATVTPASGSQYPSGTVAFYDGSKQIGTTQTVAQVGTTNVGTASITLNSLAPGIHGDITAQYAPAPGNGLIASGSSMNTVVGDPTDNPISYAITAPQATGVDISPVVDHSFTGVVATFSDGINTSTVGLSAQITWASGQTTSGTIAFLGTNDQTNINGQIVAVSLFSVTGTYTYTSVGSYPITVLITDANDNSTTVSPTARVAYAPFSVAAAPGINAVAGVPLSSVTVATFTDPGLVAALGTSNLTNLESQFTVSVNWDDGSPVDTGAVTYSAGVFSVTGSHTYSQTDPYSISVTVTPMTVSVERIDSSDPTNQNLVGDENGNTLTDSPSPDFIDQFSMNATGQTGALYTTSLPTVSTTGIVAFTNSSYSVSEGELTLSTNGEYLVTGGYNDTVSLWAPQQTFSPAPVINRVIATVNGAGVINTTTDLTDAYSGDNFRGVVSTDGTQFWTVGHSSASTNDFVHYATLAATTSTIVTGPSDPSNINTAEIFNGQLYEGARNGGNSPNGIYQVGSGLPTTAPTLGDGQTLFIETQQSSPLDVGASDKPMEPFDFFMADLSSNPNSINGVNVCYVADAQMGIARYDYEGATLGWQFSYFIDSTGSFLDSTYSVSTVPNQTGSEGDVTATSKFDPSNTNNDDVDTSKAGGVRGLTGRVVTVNGVQEVQLFATTGFGATAQPNPGESLIEVTDPAALTVPSNGLNMTDGYTTLATDAGASEFTGIAFTPYQAVTSAAQVISVANPGTQYNADGDAVSLQVQASGLPTGASWTYSASGLPATLSINSSTGLITGTVTGTAQAYSVQVTANDGQGGSASQTFTWHVSTLSVTNPGTQDYVAGSKVTLPIQTAGLPPGDTIAFSATGLPGGLSISKSTGVISGTLTAPVNTYSVTVTAKDGHGASASQTFNFNVQYTEVVYVDSVYITYGTALNNNQLSGTARRDSHGPNIPGTFTYTSAAGTVQAPGDGQPEQVTFTPTSVLYSTVQSTVIVNVARATPDVTVNPVNINFGTVLNNSQLTGTATFIVNGLSVTVPGTYTYTRADGKLLQPGIHTRRVTFTPTDLTDYHIVTTRVTITVAQGSPVVTVAPLTVAYGARL